MTKYIYDDDYSSDTIKWLKLYDSLKSHKVNYTKDPKLDEIQSQIINSNNCGLAYFFAQSFPYKRHLMQKVIIDNNNAKYSLLFAKNTENTDIKTLQKIVLNFKNINLI